MFCRSESSLEQLQFDARLFDGYNGILQADEVTVDDITYEVLDQLYVLIITFINNLYFCPDHYISSPVHGYHAYKRYCSILHRVKVRYSISNIYTRSYHQNEVFYHPLIILCSAALSLKLKLDSSSALDSPSVCYVLDVSGCLY